MNWMMCIVWLLMNRMIELKIEIVVNFIFVSLFGNDLIVFLVIRFNSNVFMVKSVSMIGFIMVMVVRIVRIKVMIVVWFIE